MPDFFLLLLLMEAAVAVINGLQHGDKIDMARNYFEERGLKQAAAFGCWNSEAEKVWTYLALQGEAGYGCCRVSLQAVTAGIDFAATLKVNYHGLGVYLDLDCPDSEIILDQFSAAGLPFNESYFWLLVSDGTVRSTDTDEALLARLPLSINAELALARPMNDGPGYELHDVYNPSWRHGGKLNVTRMGAWTPAEGFRNELTQYKYKRRGDLKGMYLNFSYVVDFPPKELDMETYLSQPIDRHVDTMHRYNYALMLQLRDYYNFTMNLIRGETWGYLINGTFNGIIGDMIKGTVDVGVTPFQFKSERLDVMEFTVQAYVALSAIVFRHPKKRAMKNSFLEPFTKYVWLATLVVGLLNWLLLYTVVRVERTKSSKTKRRSGHGNDGQQQSTLLGSQPASETFLITTAAVCQQGLSDTPRIMSGRVVYISLFFWAMLLYQFYSASIVGSLLAERPRFIKNLKDLALSDLDVGIDDMPYNHDFFRTTTDENAILLFERKIALNKRRKKFPYYKPEEGLRRVQRGGFAFQVDLMTGYKIITDTFDEDEICDLQEIELLGPKHTATCTSKHSPFKKMITYGLRQIVEHGMTHRLNSVWKLKKPQCPESHSSTPTPVSLQEFSPALIMISFAFFLSFVLMLFENVATKVFKNSRNINSESSDDNITVSSDADVT